MRVPEGQPSGGLPRNLPEFSVCRRTFARRTAPLCQRTLARRTAPLCQRTLARRTSAVGTRARAARKRRETAAQRIAQNEGISCFILLERSFLLFFSGPGQFAGVLSCE